MSRWAVLALLCLLPGLAQAVSRIELSIGDIRRDDASARDLRLSLSLDGGPLQLHADELSLKAQRWRDVTLHCPRPQGDLVRNLRCDSGILKSGKDKLPLAFALDLPGQSLKLQLLPQQNESWALQGQWGQAGWQADAQLAGASLQRLQGWLSPWLSLPVSASKGALAGRLSARGNAAGVERVEAGLELTELAFSDAEGLHAGEKLAARLDAAARRDAAGWRWQAGLDWRMGEVYWQPLYFASGGHKLTAEGSWQDGLLQVNRGELGLQGMGQLAFSGALSTSDKSLRRLQLAGRGLQAGPTYILLLKPLLEKTMLDSLEVAGTLDASLHMQDGHVQAFDVALHDFDVDDKRGRFGLYKVDARVPWNADQPTQASLKYAGGHLLKLPLGATDLAPRLNGYSLTAPELRLPLLDGELKLRDVSAAFVQSQWHWHLAADLSPLSLADFSHAVGWPAHQGRVAASIPMVTYSAGRMAVAGAMEFKVFDGAVTVRNLMLQDPLGLAPRLQADIRLRNLDLGMLTRTYSFGDMTGRLDGDVEGLVLSRWQPVQFDATFYSSPGDYPKRISQRAVENISALGGAGAAAAIQRSFLRFFKEFRYARIGLSCRLRDGVCAMDGIAPAQSGYVIVQGSGVPSITVLGYNRSVSWGELLERVQRITSGNAKPVIK